MLSYYPLATYAWYAVIIGQVVLSLLILTRKTYKRYPAFCGYVFFCTCKSLILLGIACLADASLYLTFYYGLSFTAELLTLAVAWEVYTVVYGPSNSLPEMVPIRAGQFVFGGFVSSLAVGSLFHASRGGVFTRVMMTTEQTLGLVAVATFWAILIFSHRLFLWWEPRIAGIATGFVLMLTMSTAATFVRGHAPLTAANPALFVGPGAYLCSLALWFRCHLKQYPAIQKATKEQIDFAIERMAEASRMMILETDKAA